MFFSCWDLSSVKTDPSQSGNQLWREHGKSMAGGGGIHVVVCCCNEGAEELKVRGRLVSACGVICKQILAVASIDSFYFCRGCVGDEL